MFFFLHAVQLLPHRRRRACRRTSRRSSPRLWVVLLTNAINLIDGLDGLAAGIVAIAGAALVPVRRPAVQGRLLDGDQHRARWSRSSRWACASASCRSTGTRRRSSWAMPARCSSACCSRSRRSRSAAEPTSRSRATRSSSSRPLVIPVVILGVPILDTAFSFVRRIVKRQQLAPSRRRPPPSPPHAPRPRASAARS